MSKKNAVVVSKIYTLSEIEGKKTFSLVPSFKTTLAKDATSIGEAVHNMRAVAAGKAELALNVTEAFDVWKDKMNGSGLPEFVHLFVDSSCPAQYGKVGTEARRTVTSNKIFSGIEAMIKNARAALKVQAERQKLIAAGKDPESAAEVRNYNKDVRDAKALAFTKVFCKALVDFVNIGVTDTTISNLLITVLRKKEKENDELNAEGKKLFEAASKAVLIAKVNKTEKAAEKVTVATQDVAAFATSMDQAKKAKAKK